MSNHIVSRMMRSLAPTVTKHMGSSYKPRAATTTAGPSLLRFKQWGVGQTVVAHYPDTLDGYNGAREMIDWQTQAHLGVARSIDRVEPGSVDKFVGFFERELLAYSHRRVPMLTKYRAPSESSQNICLLQLCTRDDATDIVTVEYFEDSSDGYEKAKAKRTIDGDWAIYRIEPLSVETFDRYDTL